MATITKKKIDVKPTQAREEARKLAPPRAYTKGQPLPATVGFVFSATRKKVETFYAPNGIRMQSESFPRRTDKLYIRLKERVLTDDNKMGIKRITRGIDLPFRTDDNPLIEEGFTSEEILEYVCSMKGFNKKFHVDFITSDMLAKEAEDAAMRRDEKQEDILRARRAKQDKLGEAFNAGVAKMDDSGDMPLIEDLA